MVRLFVESLLATTIAQFCVERFFNTINPWYVSTNNSSTIHQPLTLTIPSGDHLGSTLSASARGKMSLGSELIPGSAATPLTPMLTGPGPLQVVRLLRQPDSWIPWGGSATDVLCGSDFFRFPGRSPGFGVCVCHNFDRLQLSEGS